MSVIFALPQESGQAGLESPFSEIPYRVLGTETTTDVMTLALTVVTASYLGKIFSHISYEHHGGGVWTVRVHYRAPEAQSFAFDTGGGSIRIRQSRGTTSYALVAGDPATPPDFNGAINVGRDGSVEGVDIEDGVFEFSITRHLQLATVTLAPTYQYGTQAVAGGSLVVDTTYYYVVTAVYAGGESEPSNECNFTPRLTGTQTARLTWAAASGATSYKVYRGTSPGTWGTLIYSGAALTVDDTLITGSAGSPPSATFATQYLQTLADLSSPPHTNNAPFTATLATGYKIFCDTEECLFRGATGSQQGTSSLATLALTLKFAKRKSEWVALGDDGNVWKPGWRMIEARYKDVVNADFLIQQPQFAYVHQVYPTENFAKLLVT